MSGIFNLDYAEYANGEWKHLPGAVTEEAPLRLHVNGREWATIMCTPREQDELALGFLRAEGVIRGADDVRRIVVCPSGTCVEVWLKHDVETPEPGRRVITSGCGGGLTFSDLSARSAPLNSTARITPEQLFARMHDLYRAARLYAVTKGIHTSALTDGERLLLTAEDVGRHNTLDRLWGKAMKQGIATEGLILLATGRISSEMLSKAARMGLPIVVSRTSPTSLSVRLGRAWNITVIGYVRRNSLRVYSAPERIVTTTAPVTLP